MMRFKKVIVTILCITALTTVPAFAATQKTVVGLEANSINSSLIDEKIDVSLCEFIICIVKNTAGEQPLLMDTHYAHSYMLKAQYMGLIDLNKYPQKMWDEKVDTKTIQAVFKALDKQKISYDLQKLKTSLLEISASKIYINDKELKLGKNELFSYENFVMVPLRLVAEQLGYDVKWNKETYSAKLKNKTSTSVIEIGYDYYVVKDIKTGKEIKSKSVGVEPLLVNGVTYVPAEVFNILVGEGSVSNSNKIVNIKKL